MDGHAANPGDLSWEPFRELMDVTVYERTPREEVVARAKDADAVFTNKVLFDEEVLSQLPRLKYIGILATGTNAVDLEAAARRGIRVTNIPAYSTDSVAQLVFAHLLNVINSVARYASEVQQRRWVASPDFCYWDGTFHELACLTMGIIGLGNIGRKVATIAHAFGMRVVAETSQAASNLPDYITKMSREEVLAESDVLSLHCPLTDSTREMINASSLALMKPSAIIINTGRGPLVNEHDLATALREGKLAAYCADVLYNEPPSCDCPLLNDCPNAFITPHLAWGTIEARTRLMRVAYDNLRRFVEGQ